LTQSSNFPTSTGVFDPSHNGGSDAFVAAIADAATANLALTKTASPDPVTTGQNITYTITVSNAGPGTATDVVVTDNLPAATTFVSSTATGGGVSGGSGNNRTVTFASLASGASATITLVASVNCNVADETVISDTATVSAATTDPDTPNNSATATVTADNPPPAITCPANIVQSNDPGQCGAVVTFSPTVEDNCPGTTVVCSPDSGSTFPKGTTTVTCTATDSGGASATCTFTVTVNDTEAPMITCPPNQSATATSSAGAVVNYPAPTVSDNCPGVTFVTTPPSGSTFPIGQTTVTATATDASGNQATCTFTVTVSGALAALKDSFLRQGNNDTNEGANERLRIQNSGNNRAVVAFDLSGVATSGLVSATLVLNIAENIDNWGPTGRPVDVHRLLVDWTEGNGRNLIFAGGGPAVRGTGPGVTWHCATDTDINNSVPDGPLWNGGTFAAATAPSVLHLNGLTGEVSWDVTADVLAGASFGWLVKKQDEGQNGQARYYSREGAAAAGNPALAPRLILNYGP
jgi:uncharacterized repeat protein (TIGR01451 family)